MEAKPSTSTLKPAESSQPTVTNTFTTPSEKVPAAEDDSNERITEAQVEQVVNGPPDGGLKAWAVVAGGLINYIATFGAMQTVITWSRSLLTLLQAY